MNNVISKHLTISLLCLYLLLASSTSLLNQFGAYDEKRILQCLILSSILFITWLRHSEALIAIFDKLPMLSKVMLGVFFFLGLTSIEISGASAYSLLEVGLFTLIFLCILCMAIAYLDSPQFFLTLVILCITSLAFIQLISSLSAYTAGIVTSPNLNNHDLFLNYSNIRFFNQLQSWTLALIVLPLLINKQRFGKYFYIFILIAIGWWFLLLASGSRGTMLSIIIASISTYIIYRKDAFPWLKFQAISLIGGLCLYISLIIILPFFIYSEAASGTLLRTSSPGRIYLWQHAWQLIQENPVLGIGPMNFACDATNFVAAHPHNSIIQIAVEWGIPAAMIAISLFIYGIYNWIKKTTTTINTNDVSPDQKTIQICLFASLITATCHSLLSGIIVMPLSQTMMVLIIGWMLGIHLSNRPQAVPQNETTNNAAKKTTKSTTKVVLTMISLFCLIAVISGIYKTLPNQDLAIEHGRSELVKFIPRFWQQGKLCELNPQAISRLDMSYE